ncbi:turripeptide Pal9.2 [Nasonia vitripennis]|uniref:Kazal-like domain-containing protein n=1 Tax=Nasonia vitripennis TaxID=7425 RepID=A0A7M7G8Y4_NASVI|nr:turripeptide Pal9.2 [Nasonia vitripennis]
MFKQTICLVLCVLLVAMIANTEAEGEPTRCACKVTRIRNPVCGSDNKTYDNLSKLTCKNKCEGTKLTVKHDGQCS